MMTQNNNARKNEEYGEPGMRRNPYLVTYEKELRGRKQSGKGTTGAEARRTGTARVRTDYMGTGCTEVVRTGTVRSETVRTRTARTETTRPETVRIGTAQTRTARPETVRTKTARTGTVRPKTVRSGTARREMEGQRRRRPSAYAGADIVSIIDHNDTADGRPARSAPSRGRASVRRAAAMRRKRVRMQRLIAGVWILCVLVLVAAVMIRNYRIAARAGQAQQAFGEQSQNGDGEGMQLSGRKVQGLPAEVYATHPEWKEDFLTPNEYSRPGDALESVTNIFVHYTANPGTSAAQNRSYFEQQKDMHQASVSAHFIIGYEGEIIQCVPLDEIAYAVMTRNYDSISVECCYLAEDGSFTQATYDSLISLLAWLTDAYGLDSEDILRHYDCGGKKCPLYYTNHEDEWEQLKKDVDKL